MNIAKQNQKIGQLLLDLNQDLEERANPEIKISLLEMIGYVIAGGLLFLVSMGILRALSWRL